MYNDYFSKNMPICPFSFWQVLNDTFFLYIKIKRNENQWIQPHSILLVFRFKNFMTYGNWFYVDLDLSTRRSVVYHQTELGEFNV